jgi:hypothetical protein
MRHHSIWREGSGLSLDTGGHLQNDSFIPEDRCQRGHREDNSEEETTYSLS